MQQCQNLRFFISLSLLLLLISAIPFVEASSECPDIAPVSAKNRMAHLEKEIAYHNGLYYKSLRPEISDAEYDRLFAELVQLEHCFPGLASAGSPTGKVGNGSPPDSLTLRHERPMLSLTSSTGSEAVEALLHRAADKSNRPRLLVQPKVDGLPVELVYRSGRLVSAATRGDGRQGSDVTKRIQEIHGIPQLLSGRFPALVTVRGEIYADRALMRKARGSGKGYATPRHFAAATLKSRHPAHLALAALRMFPFELVDAEESSAVTSDLAALGVLSLWGFPVRLDLTTQVESMEEIRAAYREYLTRRGELPFAADGIVVKVDDLALRKSLGEGSRAPFWAAAWKFPPETAGTLVRSIRWKKGRTGRLTPVAVLEPVMLSGVMVSRVSLHNAETLQRLCIAAGDRVVIALVADIIPQVLEVRRERNRAACAEGESAEAAPLPPDACLKDGPGCREQFLARAVHFASRGGLGITGLGPGRLRKLVESGLVGDLPSLFRLRREEVASVSGFTADSARRLTEALRHAGRPEASRLLASLGIPGVGPAAARRLAKQFVTLDALLLSKEELAGGGVALQNVRSFFETEQGKELLKGLREADLL